MHSFPSHPRLRPRRGRRRRRPRKHRRSGARRDRAHRRRCDSGQAPARTQYRRGDPDRRRRVIVGRMIGYPSAASSATGCCCVTAVMCGSTNRRIKLGQYLFLQSWRQDHHRRPVRAGDADHRRPPRRRQSHAVAAFPDGQHLRRVHLGDIFGLAAYYLGRQVERLAGLVVVAGLRGPSSSPVSLCCGIFVERHEAQLIAEGRTALPRTARNMP